MAEIYSLLNIILKTFLFILGRICNKGGEIIGIKLFCILSILIVMLCVSAAAQSLQKDKITSSPAPEENSLESGSKLVDGAGTINETEALNLLIQGTNVNNSSIRWIAVKALGNYNSTQSIGALIQALGDEDSKVADQAKLSLMHIGKPAVVSLILALDRENPIIRANDAQVLGRLGDPRAIAPLRELQMEDNDSDVQTKVAYALRKLDWKEQGTS